jgi:hypothetical protein
MRRVADRESNMKHLALGVAVTPPLKFATRRLVAFLPDLP